MHAGSEDPAPGARPPGGLARGAAVTGTERGRLVAAFNGGFLLSTGAGGYEQETHVLRPLQPGLASLVIDTDGAATVGVWGQDVPRRGQTVSSVRQNLPPLVQGRRRAANAGTATAWGATLGGGTAVARSGLGQDPNGDLLYVAGMRLTPGELADALIAAGARTAMELDINPQWVQLALAPSPGAPLRPGVPGQNRPADQYLTGWTRDFVTVLARP